MKKKALRTLCSQRISIIVLIVGVILTFPDLSWGKPDRYLIHLIPFTFIGIQACPWALT